jgi:hypothetical protein
VVAAIVVRLPFCSSPAALPVLFRLWRGKGTASQVELAAEMVKLLAGAFPGRVVHGVGDAAFHGEALIVEGTTWTTRPPSNAVLYGPKPPRTGKRGRPKVKGDRLGTCAQMAAQATWTDAVIDVYGQDTAVQVAAAGALWHGSFKTAPGRVVLIALCQGSQAGVEEAGGDGLLDCGHRAVGPLACSGNTPAPNRRQPAQHGQRPSQQPVLRAGLTPTASVLPRPRPGASCGRECHRPHRDCPASSDPGENSDSMGRLNSSAILKASGRLGS